MKENGQLRIGSRGSPLALAQTGKVIQTLKNIHSRLREKNAIEIIVINTTGDRIRNQLLAELGGKGLFTKELDEALFRKEIDIAVHSMKDVPTVLPEGIVLHAIMTREDVRDAFVSSKAASLKDLPPDSSIGTASLRRKSQILNCRPDLRIVPLRGNVDTRLKKIKEGEIDATLLAYAGLKRLGRNNVVTELIDTSVILPAVGQGALAATCLESDPHANNYLTSLWELPTAASILAERAMLAVLDGSCHTPIGGLARPDGQGNLKLHGLITSPDGTEKVDGTDTAPITDAENLGKTVGERLLTKAGRDILRSTKNELPIFIPPHPEGE